MRTVNEKAGVQSINVYDEDDMAVVVEFKKFCKFSGWTISKAVVLAMAEWLERHKPKT